MISHDVNCDVAQDSDHTKLSRGTSSRLQLPEYTYRYLTKDFQPERDG